MITFGNSEIPSTTVLYENSMNCMWEIIILQPDENRLRCHTLRRASNYYIQYYCEYSCLVSERRCSVWDGCWQRHTPGLVTHQEQQSHHLLATLFFENRTALRSTVRYKITGIFRRLLLAQEYTAKLATLQVCFPFARTEVSLIIWKICDTVCFAMSSPRAMP